MSPPGLALALVLAVTVGADTVGADTVPGDRPAAMPAARPVLAPAPPRVAPPPVADRWIAEDKLRHFTLSFATVQMGYGGARMLFDHDTAVPLAAGAGLFLGLAKEARDVRAGGPVSLKDLAWDIAGVALAVAFVSRIE